MLGEKEQTFFTVKDLPPAEFIHAFAQYLKKNNLIERPKWAEYVKTSTGNNLFIQPTSLHLWMRTGFTTELLLWPEKYMLGPTLESIYSLIFME